MAAKSKPRATMPLLLPPLILVALASIGTHIATSQTGALHADLYIREALASPFTGGIVAPWNLPDRVRDDRICQAVAALPLDSMSEDELITAHSIVERGDVFFSPSRWPRPPILEERVMVRVRRLAIATRDFADYKPHCSAHDELAQRLKKSHSFATLQHRKQFARERAFNRRIVPTEELRELVADGQSLEPGNGSYEIVAANGLYYDRELAFEMISNATKQGHLDWNDPNPETVSHVVDRLDLNPHARQRIAGSLATPHRPYVPANDLLRDRIASTRNEPVEFAKACRAKLGFWHFIEKCDEPYMLSLHQQWQKSTKYHLDPRKERLCPTYCLLKLNETNPDLLQPGESESLLASLHRDETAIATQQAAFREFIGSSSLARQDGGWPESPRGRRHDVFMATFLFCLRCAVIAFAAAIVTTPIRPPLSSDRGKAIGLIAWVVAAGTVVNWFMIFQPTKSLATQGTTWTNAFFKSLNFDYESGPGEPLMLVGYGCLTIPPIACVAIALSHRLVQAESNSTVGFAARVFFSFRDGAIRFAAICFLLAAISLLAILRSTETHFVNWSYSFQYHTHFNAHRVIREKHFTSPELVALHQAEATKNIERRRQLDVGDLSNDTRQQSLYDRKLLSR